MPWGPAYQSRRSRQHGQNHVVPPPLTLLCEGHGRSSMVHLNLSILPPPRLLHPPSSSPLLINGPNHNNHRLLTHKHLSGDERH